MDLKRIKETSYQKISEGRPQVLTKNRGYGVIYISDGKLIFALPLRSNLNHPHGFKTVLQGKSWNGIDYTKALIVKEDDLEHEAFKTRNNDEYIKIKRNKDKIKKEFYKYLEEYLTCIKEGGVQKNKFKYTTLQYFHTELGIAK